MSAAARRTRRRALVAAGLTGALLGVWILSLLGILSGFLEGDSAQAAARFLETSWGLLLLAWMIPSIIALALAPRLEQRFLAGPGRVLEGLRVAIESERAPRIEVDASASARSLAEGINALAAQRDALRDTIQSEIEVAVRAAHDERTRLATLVSELAQSVIVCNLDGRILLYNQQARREFSTLSEVAGAARGVELIGIGRSIHAALDRRVLAHGLERIQRKIDRGAASLSAQFMTTTRNGQFLRVTMAPVRGSGPRGSDVGALTGFVLLLDNATRTISADAQRRRLLLSLVDEWRYGLGEIRRATDALSRSDLDPTDRISLADELREKAGAIDRRVTATLQESARAFGGRWPREDMLAAEFVASARILIEQETGRTVELETADSGAWIRIDSFSLSQVLVYLARRLVDEFDVRRLRLRLSADEHRIHVDLLWQGTALSTETVMSWELDPMGDAGPEETLTIREALDRLEGSMEFQRDRVRHEAWFRIALEAVPAVESTESSNTRHLDSRPEYFGFDLFRDLDSAGDLEDRPLDCLTYTVFDTETTGLDPAGGDRIIQIGATRIVNGRLLRAESFEQLVDPRRRIPPASIPIHGITDEMVEGMPGIETVLPAFHAYAKDSVLVAHNAAFDLKFLQMQQKACGVSFHQPVLDTLLLSALLHPNQESHRLEAIAQRFEIEVLGRHTALGDALVTADVFLRMIPLLMSSGIRTLRQAREASQKTYYARLRY